MDLYVLACEQLARVGQAYGKPTAINPTASGYLARIGKLEFFGWSPRKAAARAIEQLARGLAGVPADEVHLYYTAAELTARCDALAEAYAALGGDWRAV